MANGLVVPIDVRVNGQVVGTVSAGAHAEYVLHRGQGIYAAKTDDAFARFGLNRDDGKRVTISYVCVDKDKNN